MGLFDIKILIFSILFEFSKVGYTQVQKSINEQKIGDTTIIGKIIDYDSIIISSNSSRFGIKYFYGVHHLKVGVLLNFDSNVIVDTIIIALVYNKSMDNLQYSKNFNLKVDSFYIFDLSYFSPCHSDFPRIQGVCSENYLFMPISNKLIKKYTKIYRIVNYFLFHTKSFPKGPSPNLRKNGI